MSVSRDASTPAVATTAAGSAAATLTTASFSPPAGSVLVALCVINWSSYPGTVPGITITDTAGGTWTPSTAISTAASYSKVQIFTRPAVAAPGAITVTMSRGADTSAAQMLLAVQVGAGANTGTPQGAAATASGLGAGAGFQVAVPLTPQSLGSLLFVAADHSNTNANTPISGTTTLQATTDSTDGGVLAAGVSSAATGSLATQTLGWTATIPGTDGFAGAALEILPAPSGTAVNAGQASGAGIASRPAIGGQAAVTPGCPAGTGAAPGSSTSRPGGLITGNSKTPALYLLAGAGSVVLTNLAAAQAATGMTFNVLEVFATNQATWADWENPWFASDASQGYTTWVAADPAHRQLIVSINLIPTAAGSMANPLAWETTGAAGGFNTHAAALAANLVAAGLGYSIIRLGLEMNGNWNIDSIYGTTSPYGGTTQMRNLWAQTFAQEVAAMRAVTGAHFTFCWCPNAVVAGIPFAEYYPGDAYVDYIGVDQYDAFADAHQPVPSAAVFNQLAAQSYGLNDITAFAVSRGKPLALGEWGTQHAADGGLDDNPYYVQGIAAWAAANTVAFHSYFDSDNDGIIPLSSAYPLTLAAYKAGFAGAPAAAVAAGAAGGAGQAPGPAVRGSTSAGLAGGAGQAPRPATAGAGAVVTEHPSTPAPASVSGPSATSASFTPPAGSLLLVLAFAEFGGQPASSADHWTVSDTVTGAWAAGTHRLASADTANWSSAALLIAVRYFAASPGPVTVTASNSDAGAGGGITTTMLAVRVLTGAGTDQSGGAAVSGSYTITGTYNRSAALTTTRAGSLAYLAGGESWGAVYTPAGTSVSVYDPLIGGLAYGGFSRAAAATGTPGAVTLGWVADRYSGTSFFAYLALEVMPAVTAVVYPGCPAGAGLAPGPAPAAVAGTAVAAGLAAGAGLAPGPAASAPQAAAAGAAAGAGTAPRPAVTGMGIVFAAGAAGAGAGPRPAGGGFSQGTPPAPAGLGVAARPVTIGFGQLLAGQALGQGTAPAPGELIYLPPIFMGESGGQGRSRPAPGCSQVAVAPPGSANWTYLGMIGHVADLKYSFVMPGGADKMSCTVQVPAAFRHTAFWPGCQVRVWRGGSIVWSGRLDEPAGGQGGWSVTAVGDGQRAQDFTAQWSGTWPAGQPDDAVNQAVARGLPWAPSAVGQPSWAWYGQPPDSGSQSLTALLNLICTRGAGTWYVNSHPGGLPGPDLRLLPIPSVPDRLLLVTTPVARTLGAQVNRLVIRYQVSADNTGTGTAAAYALTSVTDAADIAAHQPAEGYLDLSQAGVMSSGAAQAVGNSILSVYQRASYAGPFTAAHGQLMTVNGTAIDPGTDQAGTCVKAVITDFGYGGEVTPATPVIFPVAGYEWDDHNLLATLTPFQTVAQSLSGLISAYQTVNAPITVTAGG